MTRSTLVDTSSRSSRSQASRPVRARLDGQDTADLLAGVQILLVEDNQRIAVELLESAGARVEVADNGRIGVERLQAAHGQRRSTWC